MYTAMKSIFEDKNNQEDLFFKGPGKDLEVRLVCWFSLGGAKTTMVYRAGPRNGGIFFSCGLGGNNPFFCMRSLTPLIYLRRPPPFCWFL